MFYVLIFMTHMYFIFVLLFQQLFIWVSAMTGQGIHKISEFQHQTFYLICVQLGMGKTYTQFLFLTLLVLRIWCGFKFYFIWWDYMYSEFTVAS